MKRFTTLSLALLATLILGTAFAQQRGGTLVFGRYADSLFLDPVLNDANLDIWVLTNLYDPLLQPTADGKDVKADLATSWSFSDGGTTLTLTMRPGIKFADGSPITPQDAKWSLDRARDPNNGIWNFTLSAIDSITTSGDQVILHLKHPDPTILPALAMFNASIMPEKLFEAEAGATDAAKAKAFAQHPIGSGPFVLKTWKRGSYMLLDRNPYYWEKGADGKALPYLDHVRFDIVPDDATRILKLQSRELDAAEFIPLSRVGELQKDPNINMTLFPSTQVNSVLMNNRPTLPNGTPNPLSSLEVRQAINYATNKKALIQVVNHGIGSPMQSYMSTTTPYYVATRGYAYDLEKAKSLLAQAGFPNGFTVSALATAGSQNDLALLTALQSMWGEAGIKLKIEQLDAATKTERYRNNDFQMRTAGWTNDINDPSEITSYFAVYKNVQSLHTGFKSADIDKLFTESQQELDKTKRAQEYKQIQKIYMDAAPIVFLYQTPYPVAMLNKVKGLTQIPLGNYIFKTAYLTQ